MSTAVSKIPQSKKRIPASLPAAGSERIGISAYAAPPYGNGYKERPAPAETKPDEGAGNAAH